MSRQMSGVLWGLAFVGLESVQFVFFGNVFQRMSSVLFGALVLGITSMVFIGWAVRFRQAQFALAMRHPRRLWAINICATFSWLTFLLAVQFIEPAIAYTLGAGVMPITAWLLHKAGVPEGEPMRNRIERLGNLVILGAIAYLAAVTIAGHSGFARGGGQGAALGVALALGEGALFTWLLVLCQRIDRVGVGPGVVFGLRFVLYVVVAGALAAGGFDAKAPMPASEIAVIVGIGLLLIVPPLYALQQAVSKISTLTISALTATGPFVIFGLQILEGRIGYSTPTLIGLVIYFCGAVLGVIGAVRAMKSGV